MIRAADCDACEQPIPQDENGRAHPVIVLAPNEGTAAATQFEYCSEECLAAVFLGRKGGQASTAAKRRAAKANGKKGGRPKKS